MPTLIAVSALPTVQTHLFTSLIAPIVTELVITWFTEDRTSGSVVVEVTYHAVLVFQLGLVGVMDKVTPLRTLLQIPWNCQSGYPFSWTS